MGYVSTKPVFLKKKTVYENLKYVLKNRKVSATELEKRVNDTIIEFNIEKYKDVKAKDLSLYEQYIISLIRLTLRPLEILLVDDIFEGLTDEENKNILKFVKEFFIDKKVTTLVASSRESLLEDVCERFIHFNSGSIEKK